MTSHQLHKAFTIPNLQRVFLYAAFSSKAKYGKHLLSLAYVCRIFRETLIDYKVAQIVWTQQDEKFEEDTKGMTYHQKIGMASVPQILLIKSMTWSENRLCSPLQWIAAEMLECPQTQKYFLLNDVNTDCFLYQALRAKQTNIVEVIFDFIIAEKTEKKLSERNNSSNSTTNDEKLIEQEKKTKEFREALLNQIASKHQLPRFAHFCAYRVQDHLRDDHVRSREPVKTEILNRQEFALLRVVVDKLQNVDPQKSNNSSGKGGNNKNNNSSNITNTLLSKFLLSVHNGNSMLAQVMQYYDVEIFKFLLTKAQDQGEGSRSSSRDIVIRKILLELRSTFAPYAASLDELFKTSKDPHFASNSGADLLFVACSVVKNEENNNNNNNNNNSDDDANSLVSYIFDVAERNKISAKQLLLDAKNPATGKRALNSAVYHLNLDAIRFLLDKAAKEGFVKELLSATDNDDRNCLFEICRINLLEVANRPSRVHKTLRALELLIKKCAETKILKDVLSQRSKRDNHSVLMACAATKNMNFEIFKIFLEVFCRLDLLCEELTSARDMTGNSLFRLCCSFGNVEENGKITKLILERASDLSVVESVLNAVDFPFNQITQRPLFTAVAEGQTDTVRYILEQAQSWILLDDQLLKEKHHGSFSSGYRNHLLMIALVNTHIDIVRLLISFCGESQEEFIAWTNNYGLMKEWKEEHFKRDHDDESNKILFALFYDRKDTCWKECREFYEKWKETGVKQRLEPL